MYKKIFLTLILSLFICDRAFAGMSGSVNSPSFCPNKNLSSSGNKAGKNLRGQTFFANYTKGKINAKMAKGSRTATFTNTSGNVPVFSNGISMGTTRTDVLTYPILNNRTAEQETIFIKFIPDTDFANDGTERDLTDTQTRQRFIRKRSATNTDRLSFQPNSTDSINSVSYTTTVPLANTSYVVCGVAYGTTAGINSEIYLNGVSERSETTDYTSPAWGTIFSLGSASGGGNQLNGIIQKVLIFNRALTADEVLRKGRRL